MEEAKMEMIVTVMAMQMLAIPICKAQLLPEIYNTEWQRAGATWYGEPQGDGTDAGACGYGDLAISAYGSRISAGSAPLFRQGHGCGACFQIRCTLPLCRPDPIPVVITDECPGGDFCGNNQIHFDLSGTAFGDLAITGRDSDLRNVGVLPLLYKRIPCSYGGENVTVEIDQGSTPHWLAFVVRYQGGAGDLRSVEIQEANSSVWQPMSHNWGASWDFDGPIIAPVSLRFKSGIAGKVLVAPNAIPLNWRPGRTYDTGVQFPTA